VCADEVLQEDANEIAQVTVPIVPVNGHEMADRKRPSSAASSHHPAEEEWKDQSGRYWIGYEGRAKLCFCRILRSQTVMVRVGGGWVELSR
jgi:hypothetical protein